MRKFDFNEIDKYKEAMELLGVVNFNLETLRNPLHFGIIKNGGFKAEYQLVSYEVLVRSEDWEEFKKKVANYFLNK